MGPSHGYCFKFYEAKFDLPVARTMDSLLFEPDQEFLASMGMVS